jgi:hypothetical protein
VPCHQATITEDEASSTGMSNSDNGESRGAFSVSRLKDGFPAISSSVNAPLRVLTSLSNFRATRPIAEGRYEDLQIC